jgi:hypothetical protein
MTWDPRAERIQAQGQADLAAAQAEAIRAQTSIAQQQANAAISNARDDQRNKRRAERRHQAQQRKQERRERRREQLDAAAAGVRRWALPVVAVGSPAVIAWNGQYRFGKDVMHLGMLAPLLPIALEGSVLYSARLAHEAIEADQPAGRYRAMTWTQAGIASCLNVWHGLTSAGHDLHHLTTADYQVGVALGLTSLLGIGLLELTVALKQRKQRGRTAVQLRQALIRRLRYPRLCVQAAAVAAARDITDDEAWQAAWVDRYGVGPDTTRRTRRTARAILARQQKADRGAARTGDLIISDGVIIRTVEQLTDAEREAAALEATFADQVEAWLADREPPDAGSIPSPAGPDTHGPQGSAKPIGESPETPAVGQGRIRDDQREPTTDRKGHIARSTSGAQARRAAGAQTRRRIADHLRSHPDHANKPKQIAEALDLGLTTVKRHLRAIQTGKDTA